MKKYLTYKQAQSKWLECERNGKHYRYVENNKVYYKRDDWFEVVDVVGYIVYNFNSDFFKIYAITHNNQEENYVILSNWSCIEKENWWEVSTIEQAKKQAFRKNIETVNSFNDSFLNY